MPKTLLLVLLALGSLADAGPADRSYVEQALSRACEWLWSRQGEDGGWHSETYGLLKSGQAYTPFILHALLSVPVEIHPRPAGGIERALGFLRAKVNDEGAIGLADPDLLEYPIYATAYALRCIVRTGEDRDEILRKRMKAYLLAQQFTPSCGFDAQSLVYGAWGFGGKRSPGSPGHVDLAHTRRVLQALREAGVTDPVVYDRAQAFLRLLQRHPREERPQPSTTPGASGKGGKAPYDGGFYFSPVVLAANKGREEPGRDGERATFRSYATATCDGLLALRAAGVPRDDERVSRALRWLEEHPRWETPEGIPAEHPEPWGDALHFYHLAVRSEVYAEMGGPAGWKEKAGRILAPLQLPDGSYVNKASHLMKEDDPLLATTLAVVAMLSARP
ncbi:MAG: terpene cyclase/mutase family protein [Planctomycetota bacterium]|nr:terpene cyclase/mutase family protein [Planctomycetota bacterium]